MTPKFWVLVGLTVGSLIGGYIPTFFGASFLSLRPLVGNTVGGIVGIYVSYQMVKGTAM
ncbi:MAG: hypothetical protein WBO77_02275 [Microgenomates group bacterium]